MITKINALRAWIALEWKRLKCDLGGHKGRELVAVYPSTPDTDPGDWVIAEYYCPTCKLNHIEQVLFEEVKSSPLIQSK